MLEGPRVVEQPLPGEERGLIGLRGLLERAGADLQGHADQPGPVPRQRHRGGDEEGQPDQPEAAAGLAAPAGGDDLVQERPEHVHRIRGLRQQTEAQHEAERHGPPRPAKPVGLEQHAERRRDHRGQRQVELEVQQREHHEGRGAEEEGREEARPRVPERAAGAEGRGEAHGEEAQHDGLGRERGDREDQVEGAGGARDQGRIEGRVPDHRRPDAALRQVLVAAEGALEVVGVVPLGRTPVDADPRDGDGGEDGEERGEPDSRMPNGAPWGAGGAAVRYRTGRWHGTAGSASENPAEGSSSSGAEGSAGVLYVERAGANEADGPYHRSSPS